MDKLDPSASPQDDKSSPPPQNDTWRTTRHSEPPFLLSQESKGTKNPTFHISRADPNIRSITILDTFS